MYEFAVLKIIQALDASSQNNNLFSSKEFKNIYKLIKINAN